MINAMGCSPDGQHLYVGGWDKSVHSWDLDTFTHSSQVDLGQPVNCIRVHPDSGNIFVAGNSGLIAKLINH